MMKKIKLLSLVLAILMLAGMATLFSSCGKTDPGVITPSEDTVDVDLSDYAVLYGESQGESNFTHAVRAQFDTFVAKLNAATGLDLKMKQASRVDIEEGAKEILIGATDREESEKALKKIKGDGFIIQVLEDKIVLVGTNNLYTVMAVDYFVKSYLSGEEASETLTVNESVKANEMQSVVLTNSGNKNEDVENAYTYVYKNGLGMVPNAYLDAGYDTTQSIYRELPMIVASKLTDKMASIAKLSMKHFPVGTDAVTNEKEVLIGLTSREESKAALAEINETQFIIAVRGDRVVINAFSNYVLNQAAEAYMDLLKEATVKDENGNTLVCLPREFRLIGEADHKWQTDFPKPEGEGIELYNTMDNNDNSLQYLYRGTGVNKAAYDAYCAQLKAAGYKEVQSNAVEGSVFKFFTNTSKDVALYVAFNAYAHKDDFDEFEWTVVKTVDNKVIVPYGFENTIRIVSSTIENAFYPDTELLSKPSYTYNNETAITSMPLYSTDVGHCYIVTLEDGSFIVYDGGNSVMPAGTHHMIWNLLKELHTQVWGEAPSSTNKIRIAAWILSHAHGDHYRAFTEMLRYYGKTGLVEMDYMIANVPSNESYCSEDFDEVGGVMDPDAIKRLQSSINGGFQLIKPHTGMKFHLANVELETMVTWEDLNPVQTPNTNDTNTVFRMTITSANSDEQTTMMWLGDANRLQSRFMCATYGTYLKSDMTTVAHHGNAGCEIDLYEMIDPETIFWTHNTNAVQGYLNPDNINRGWQWEVDQYFTYELASVKRVFTNGGQMFTTPGGTTLMDEIYQALRPAQDGYIQLRFVDGVADFDHVKELHFAYEKLNGSWVVQGVEVTDLAHTDISGGAEAFENNPNGVMTFVSNYMVKCAKGCPTGYHTH